MNALQKPGYKEGIKEILRIKRNHLVRLIKFQLYADHTSHRAFATLSLALEELFLSVTPMQQ